MTIRAWHLGVWWTLTSRVTAYDRPASFVDEQVRGPFSVMRHEHLCRRRPDGPPVRDGKPYSAIAHLAEEVGAFGHIAYIALIGTVDIVLGEVDR